MIADGSEAIAPIVPDPGPPSETTARAARTLVAVNIVVAALGMVQSLVVAGAVGAAGLGVIGVLLAVDGAVANFVDLRLFDVAATVYYEDHGESGAVHRRSVVQLCLLANGALALMMVVLGAVGGVFVGDALLHEEVRLIWVLLGAVSVGITFFCGNLFGIQRLTGELRRAGAWRLVAQVGGVGISLGIVLATRDISGYFLGLAASAAFVLVVNGVGTADTWRRSGGLPLLDRSSWRAALPSARRRRRAVVGANVYAYSKVVHRSADTLIVAAVAGDVATGVYRLARSVTDYSYVLFDGVNQVWFPRMLQVLASGDLRAFWRHARRFLVVGITTAAVGVAAALLAMPPLIGWLLPADFEAGVPAIAVLVVPFAFVLGVHLWLWPLLLHEDAVTRFGLRAIAAAGVQVAVTVALGRLDGGSALDGAVGYVAYYLLLYVPTIVMFRRSLRRAA